MTTQFERSTQTYIEILLDNIRNEGDLSTKSSILDRLDKLLPREDLLEKMAVVALQPGDTLVLMAAEALSDVAVATLNTRIKQNFPDVKVIVLDKGVTLGIVREETHETV